MRIAGKWRIAAMDLWEQEAIDLVGPAFIEFSEGRSGQFRFIAVDGWMDCLHNERNGRPYVSNSPGTAMTSAIQPVVAAGQSSRRTAPCVAAFTFMVATTRVSRRSALKKTRPP